jgi:hypothetical protein
MQPSTLLARMALLTATTLVTSSCSRNKTRRSVGQHAHAQNSAGYAQNATGELAAVLVRIALPTATTLVTSPCGTCARAVSKGVGRVQQERISNGGVKELQVQSGGVAPVKLS